MAWPRNAATSSGESVRQLQVGLEHARTIGRVNAHAVAYGITRSLDNPLPFAFIALERRAGGLRSALSSTAGPFSITGGFDVEVQKDERDEFDNVNGAAGNTRARDQTDNIANLGPFVRAAIDLATIVTATAGVRYDRTRFEIVDRFLGDGRDDSGTRTMSAISPSAGVTLRLSDVTTFASISTAFQTPTTTELINNPNGTGLNDLEPQRSISYEAGMRTQNTRFAFELSAYHTRVRDALVPFQIVGGDGREFFRNAGRTRQQGVEAAAQLTLLRGLRAAASYTWNDFVFLDDGLPQSEFEGNQLPGVPRHHLAGRLTATARGGYAEIEVEHNSSFYAADSNAEPSRNPAATVIDGRLGYSARLGTTRLEPFVGVNNLLNEKYFSSVVINAAGARYFEPAPGLNLYLGLGVAIGNWP
jgi:iron complex outermembrane recepter protein